MWASISRLLWASSGGTSTEVASSPAPPRTAASTWARARAFSIAANAAAVRPAPGSLVSSDRMWRYSSSASKPSAWRALGTDVAPHSSSA